MGIHCNIFLIFFQETWNAAEKWDEPDGTKTTTAVPDQKSTTQNHRIFSKGQI